MANTRSSTKATSASVAKKASGTRVGKQAKAGKAGKAVKAEKQKSTVQSKKLEKELNEKKEEEAASAAAAEEEFQLPSDSDDSDNEGSEESDTELAIHEDIIAGNKGASSEASTKVSNQAGHTVIQPAGSGAGSRADKSDGSKGKRGVIYIGRLPNGFEEKELRKYFEQFGEITRLRLSRNKKTGKSKHYAFLEFKEAEVAKVAAETMDNYLLMGHLLSVSVLDSDKVHEKLFVGANIKFKVVPYGKLNQLKHDKKKSKAEWEKLSKNHANSIKSKQESLAAMGIDFDINNL